MTTTMQKQVQPFDYVLTAVDSEMIQTIIKAACEVYDIAEKQLRESTGLTQPRHHCYFIIKENIPEISYRQIGLLFNRKRTSVKKALEDVECHKNIYRRSLDTLNTIVKTANNFEKKFEWHLPLISTTR